MKNFLIVGSGGREASISKKIAETGILFAVMSHMNSTIIEACTKSGGDFLVGDIYDAEKISAYAESNCIDIAIVNNDNILYHGITDVLISRGIPVFGPTREGAKIEWSKSFARQVVNKVAPESNVLYEVVEDKKDLRSIIDKFNGIDLVVKPDGLTGGKGVKVMGPHLKDYEEVYEYAKKIIEIDGKVILEEKLAGHEFTIMGFTDGNDIVISPVTYDYPFRFDGDNGPGTGGMGSITYVGGLLPFLTNKDIKACKEIMKRVIKELNKDKRIFNGVLNAGFFKDSNGTLKVMEFNARIGDPEALNIMALLKVPLSDVVEACAIGNLENLPYEEWFYNYASIVVYITSKKYAMGIENEKSRFYLTPGGINNNFDFICANCEKKENGFLSEKSGRLAAFIKVGSDFDIMVDKLYEIISTSIAGNIDYRKDIGKSFN